MTQKKETMACPSCGGTKLIRGFACPGFRPEEFPCHLCADDGTVFIADYERGKEIREERMSRKIGLREEAQRIDMSAGYLSHLERGGDPKGYQHD